jgi:hypothetical protein
MPLSFPLEISTENSIAYKAAFVTAMLHMLRTTQLYAKVCDEMVRAEMSKLSFVT